MDRRHFLAYLAATSASCVICAAANAEWPGQDDGSNSDIDHDWPGLSTDYQPSSSESSNGPSRLSLQGSTLSASSAASLGNLGLRILRGTGIAEIDNTTYAEARFLTKHIGNYRPSLAFVEDSEGNNAMAVSRDITGRGSPHGAVLLGVNLVHDLLTRPGARTQFSNAWSIAAVMAHEWAHIAQFANGVRTRDGRVVGLELMSDTISGWYLAKKLQTLGGIVGPDYLEQMGATDQTAAARAVYSLGDTNFTDRNHHGTHEQRLQAFLSGHTMGMRGGTFQHIFNYGISQFIRH